MTYKAGLLEHYADIRLRLRGVPPKKQVLWKKQVWSQPTLLDVSPPESESVASSIEAPKDTTPILAKKIVKIVASLEAVSEAGVLSDRRYMPLVQARQIISWLARTELKWSFPRIGVLLNKDHTSIIHYVQKIEQDPVLLERAAQAWRLLQANEEQPVASPLPTTTQQIQPPLQNS